MSSIVRFGVSLEKELLEKLDTYASKNHYTNRSQAIRQLINNHTVVTKWENDSLVAGSITIVYDHHRRELSKKLTHVQHDYHNIIMCSQHIHLEKDLCMEIIAVKGKASILNELASKIIAIKGIHHGKLTMTKAD